MATTNLLGGRVKRARDRANMTQAELADCLGVRQQAISNVETNRNELKWEMIVDLAKALNVSVDYLACLTDDPISCDDRFVRSIGYEFVEYVPIQRDLAVAGINMGNLVGHEVGGLPFRRFRLEQLGIDPTNARVFRVKGDSMCPTLTDGGAILVDYAQSRLYDGGIFVFEIDDTLMVKRARYSDQWMMVSDNPDPAFASIPFTEEAIIWGRVVWTSRIFYGSK